jgi:hypothetical protein
MSRRRPVLRAFANQFKTRSITAAFLFPMALVAIESWVPCLSAQAINIRLLNAKTGKPMNNKMVTFEWGSGDRDRSAIRSDEQGLGSVAVPAGEHEFTLEAGPKVGKEPYRIPYFDCNEGRPTFIQISSVLQNGLVLRNTCGQQSAVAKPGEIVFWLLPLPWWEPDMQ